MQVIPFTKAHGARNDFLLTWEKDAPPGDRAAQARAICDRHSGVGADGWMLVRPGAGDHHGAIQLYNSDGSVAEISGNGTRCAAAFLIEHGHAAGEVRVLTGAGVKSLRLLDRSGGEFRFEMNMGQVEIRDLHYRLKLARGEYDAVVMWVGNPQCAVMVDDFDFDWRALGALIEHHPDFVNRTNVSFVKALDRGAIDVRFWERGAGETQSSGTGSTGAAAAARARGLIGDQVRVNTPAGPLELCWREDIYLVGPAALTVEGTYRLWDN